MWIRDYSFRLIRISTRGELDFPFQAALPMNGGSGNDLDKLNRCKGQICISYWEVDKYIMVLVNLDRLMGAGEIKIYNWPLRVFGESCS